MMNVQCPPWAQTPPVITKISAHPGSGSSREFISYLACGRGAEQDKLPHLFSSEIPAQQIIRCRIEDSACYQKCSCDKDAHHIVERMPDRTNKLSIGLRSRQDRWSSRDADPEWVYGPRDRSSACGIIHFMRSSTK
jgi:hypothetical protein